MEKLEMKECMRCHQKFPKTLEFFFQAFHKKRSKSYLNSKCKKCSQLLNKEYRKNNAEKFRETQRRWSKSPKGIYKSLKNSTRGHLVKISQKKFMEWCKSQPKKCFYCGLKEENLQLVLDAYNNKTFRLSVDRIDSSKDYEEGNMVLCCLRCNHIKGNFFTQSEMVEIGKKYIARRWNNAQTH